jgi:hypothetical protein
MRFLQSELYYINNYARQSFNQNYFTSTTTQDIPSIRTILHQQLRITFLQSELLWNYARHSFNQNFFTLTTSHYILLIRITLHQRLRNIFLQSELLYINNFALHSSNQKHLIQTALHCVTWFRTTIQQQFHFLLAGHAFRTAVDHVTLRDCCSRCQEPSNTMVSQSLHSQQTVRTSL